ncbi:MAG: tetratricopeptide repeat protein [Tannerella forsythia]|uniref:tetratricopeptide repeat protein n=1 Tax=Tannerella forsythia TaxID=28112 RepID=UPI00360E2529
MTIQEIQTACTRTTEALDRGALKTAFDTLQGLIAGSQTYTYQNRLDKLQETYQYMLRYYIEGSGDPMQEQIYAGIRTQTYELTDRLRHELLADISPETCYVARRTLTFDPVETGTLLKQIPLYAEAEETEPYEASVNRLFGYLWTTTFLSQETVVAVREALADPHYPSAARSQIVSALLLGLQQTFDKEKLLLLFDAASPVSDETIRIRALIAIILTLYTYRRRTAFYPEIERQLGLLAESPDFKRLLLTIILRFILARETEKISHKLQEEIIPEMMRLRPQINLGVSWSDLIAELSNDEMNPEWKSDKLTKWLEEYNEMQEEGADVMHSTFIHLKHFSFFREVGNWFLPFSIDHSTLKSKADIGITTIDTLLQASFMCDSDKYSLYFSLEQIPEIHRKMILHQLDVQINQINAQQAQELKNRQTKAENVIGLYIQSLYRFYKLYPRHADFDDIFNEKLDFHHLTMLKPYISDTETLLQIAEFYLRKGYFEDALTIYRRLIEEGTGDEVLYQKSGYCRQMAGDMEGALRDYLRSEMLNPESPWLLRRIAGCYRTLKQPEEALKFFLRYDTISPDNLSVLMNIGHCYSEQKDYKEALRYYFKVDYLSPDNRKAQRAIAWCSFLSGKYDQARNYYRKVLEDEPQAQDFLNAGHTEWAVQNMKGALELYKQSVYAAGNFKAFQELLKEDIPDLIRAGIKPSEMPLLMDQLRYSLG